MSQIRYSIGIDEAGRGPLAGPLSVAAVMVPKDMLITDMVDGITDSKLLTEVQREDVYEELRTKNVSISHTFIRPETIDRYGMSYALHNGVKRILQKICTDPDVADVKLDGSLSAPSYFSHQETIIRGDLTNPLISAASIVAKVKRDRAMIRYAKRYPMYGFERHKGYGTKSHREIVKKIGPCELHRLSFLKNILEKDHQ